MAGVKRRPLTRRIDAAVLTALVIENGDGSDLLTDYFAAGDAVASGPVFGARDPGPSARDAGRARFYCAPYSMRMALRVSSSAALEPSAIIGTVNENCVDVIVCHVLA